MRWRLQGTGWAVCDPVHILAHQIDPVWPKRHPADGTVASSGHAGYPASDHGISPEGLVRAIDVGEYGLQGDILVDQLLATRDWRIAYIIHDREDAPSQIWRSYQTRPHHPEPWTPAPYRGSNPHRGHVHVSMLRNARADRDSTPFDIDLGGGALAFMEVVDVQQALVDAGFDLGTSGPDGNGVDDQWGPISQGALTEALTPASSTDPGDEYATIEWVRGFVNRKTSKMIEWGDQPGPFKKGSTD